MTRRLASALAALVVVGVTATGVAPAHASPAMPRVASATGVVHPNVDVATVAAAIKAAYDAYKSFTSGGTSINSAVSQILAAIQSAQNAIINHIDAIAAAEARACAQDAVIDFPNFGALTPDNQQSFAIATTACADRIDSLLATVSDKSAKDQLGFSANAVGPIALITRSRTGLGNTGLVSVLRDTNQQVSASLTPSCSFIYDPDFQGKVWMCLAYNGNYYADPNKNTAQEQAATGTSWQLANNVLTQLASL